MSHYLIRRFIYMILMLIAVSIFAFIIIQLPPGSYLDTYVAELEQQGGSVSEAEIAALKERYGLNQPMYVRYFKWMGGILQGDMGRSFTFSQPVTNVIGERLPPSFAIAFLSLAFTYLIGIPIGIYAAARQYSVGDYVFTVLGFIGMAIPNFFLALILMVAFYKWFGVSIGGLFSQEYLISPWSWGKVWNMLKHMPIPLIVIGTASAAGILRTMRGLILDELKKQYVIAARARGLHELKILFKIPVRLALNPIVSGIGFMFPRLVSGAAIVGIVLNLPTLGPVLFQALQSQDTYLAGSIVMLMTFMTVIGVFISDVLLALIDPRIRYT